MKPRYLPIAAGVLAVAVAIIAKTQPVTSDQEKAVDDRMHQLRGLPDDKWAVEVGQLADLIYRMPSGAEKQRLVGKLANLATEGDAGHHVLQTIADTLTDVITSLPVKQRAPLCNELAVLVRYEHVLSALDDERYFKALAELEDEDQRRLSPAFTLSDLQGRQWSLQDLRGKVVLVNFWATWCPPRRKEMPDMQALYERFAPRGLEILAISDEDSSKVEPFVAAQKYTYPILLDPGRTVNQIFRVEGIPKSFLYGRDGKLVAEAIDRRTSRQFLEMLRLAGLG